MNKPYFITSLGLNEGTFIRIGAHTVQEKLKFIEFEKNLKILEAGSQQALSKIKKKNR